MKKVYRILSAAPAVLQDFLFQVRKQTDAQVSVEITSTCRECGVSGFVRINGEKIREFKRAIKIIQSKKFEDFFTETEEPKNNQKTKKSKK